MNFSDLISDVLNGGIGLVGQKYQADAAKANANAANRAAAAQASQKPAWLMPVILGVGALVLGVVLFKAFAK